MFRKIGGVTAPIPIKTNNIYIEIYDCNQLRVSEKRNLETHPTGAGLHF